MFCLAAVLFAGLACDKHIVERTFDSHPVCVQLLHPRQARWQFVELPREEEEGVELVIGDPEGIKPAWGKRVGAKFKKELAEHGFTYKFVGEAREEPAAGDEYEMTVAPLCVSEVTAVGGAFTDPNSRPFECEQIKDCLVLSRLARGEFENVTLRLRHPEDPDDPEVVLGIAHRQLSESEPAEAEPSAPDDHIIGTRRPWPPRKHASADVARAAHTAEVEAGRAVEPDAVEDAQLAFEVQRAVEAAQFAARVHSLSRGWSRSMLENARRGARPGHATVLASTALRLEVDGVEIARAQIDANAPCLDAFAAIGGAGRTRVDTAVRFDGTKEKPLLISREAKLELIWWDSAKNCVVHQNITAETFGRQPDPSWDFHKEVAARMVTPKSGKTLTWKGERGDFVNDVLWPAESSESVDLVPGIDGAERLLVGPYRAVLTSSDGRSLYELVPPAMRSEVCLSNSVRVWPDVDDKVRIHAKIWGESTCDYDVHGHVHWAEEVATIQDGRTVVDVHHANYKFGRNECGGDQHTTLEFNLGGRVLSWRYTKDDLCIEDEAVPCGNLVRGCAAAWCAIDLPSVAYNSTSAVSIRHGDRITPVTHTGQMTVDRVEPRCGTGPKPP